MAGVLRVVCTPIGNLEDISKRALRVIAEADVILAENIDNCMKLLRLLEIPTEGKKVLSCAQHDELARIKVVLERLLGGAQVVLMSDAGAPAVSDPGGRIVEAAAGEGYKVEVIPGASAVVAALMGAGLISHRFAFLGFLPKKGKEREKLISDSRRAGFALVIYESPLRIEDTLDDLFKWCGPARVVVARELTKHFETFHRGVLGSPLVPEVMTRGEMVIVVEAGDPNADAEKAAGLNDAEIYAKVKALVDAGSLSTKEGARKLANELHIPSRKAYERLLKNEG